jgi:ribulose-5-phosphate 4-epimerase/fuculose-1-phosphate aldolase
VLGRAHALILRGNGALTCASNPELAVARMWQLAAACEVWLTASASGMPRPMDASEAESWRAAEPELRPRLWQHLRRSAAAPAAPAASTAD